MLPRFLLDLEENSSVWCFTCSYLDWLIEYKIFFSKTFSRMLIEFESCPYIIPICLHTCPISFSTWQWCVTVKLEESLPSQIFGLGLGLWQFPISWFFLKVTLEVRVLRASVWLERIVLVIVSNLAARLSSIWPPDNSISSDTWNNKLYLNQVRSSQPCKWSAELRTQSFSWCPSQSLQCPGAPALH